LHWHAPNETIAHLEDVVECVEGPRDIQLAKYNHEETLKIFGKNMVGCSWSSNLASPSTNLVKADPNQRGKGAASFRR
jgi:hypothetical protein